MNARNGARACAAALLCIASTGATAAVSCSLSSGALAFGEYDVFSLLPSDSSAAITLSCSQTGGLGSVDSFTYTLSIGPGSHGSVADRRMASGSAQLSYNLYSLPLRLLVWGNGTGGSVTVGGLGCVGNTVIANPLCPLSTMLPFTVFGRIPARQDAKVGTYSDVVVVTVTY